MFKILWDVCLNFEMILEVQEYCSVLKSMIFILFGSNGWSN